MLEDTNTNCFFPGIFTEPAHIFGFWDNYPEPEKWTDAQLGIPADDDQRVIDPGVLLQSEIVVLQTIIKKYTAV